MPCGCISHAVAAAILPGSEIGVVPVAMFFFLGLLGAQFQRPKFIATDRTTQETNNKTQSENMIMNILVSLKTIIVGLFGRVLDVNF